MKSGWQQRAELERDDGRCEREGCQAETLHVSTFLTTNPQNSELNKF